ncbi:VOC family protein [Gracilibacillus alcaliphilus]|uniref:VOC family protein n=1 Tax=Gracilibacillus alcaliphilus TaxID=1401441 RepID=UPI0019592E27|nr:VOC family protein [Gracilibacillus alcaliphilus]MBM7676439.1 lactoylglutathione lyase [Gracilibacillus alcaliphilus]
MIHQIGQVMLYVNDQEQAKAFWTEKLGFYVVSEEDIEGMRWIEMATANHAGTTIILQDKDLAARLSPEQNLVSPSLVFFTEDLEALYDDLIDREVTVGEMLQMPTGKVFHFADHEGNYFAVMESKEMG